MLPPVTTLFLIRHALTAVTGKTLYGQTPGVPLDGRGRAQAERLAERFAGIRLAAVYSSPLDRCVETMEPLAAQRGLPVTIREGLIEMDAGSWTNRPLGQLRRTRRWRQVQEAPSRFTFPDGEGFAQAQARALTEVHAIAARHPRSRVAVGSHGDIIRMLVAHLSGAHLDLFQRTMSEPASVSVVHLGDGPPRILLVNDTGVGLARFAERGGGETRAWENLRG
jgi:probable phosphoglycerate mutase